MSRDALAVMDGGKCILQLRGVRPCLSDKYDLTRHPDYKLTGEYDKKICLTSRSISITACASRP